MTNGLAHSAHNILQRLSTRQPIRRLTHSLFHAKFARTSFMTSSIRRSIRTQLYDSSVGSASAAWYSAVLHRVPEHTHLLIVGVATGSALAANAGLLIAKEILVVALEADPDYAQRCLQNVEKHNLQRQVQLICSDVAGFTPPCARLFDHVYFAGALTLDASYVAALAKAIDFLRDREDGRIYFTQTFHLQKDVLMEWIKPSLSFLTSTDHGNVIYEADFDDCLQQAGLAVVEAEKIEDDVRVENVKESRLTEARSALYVKKARDTIN